MSDNLSLAQGASIAFSSGALAAGTTAATIKSTATVTYTVDGRFYSKNATDNVSVAYTGASVYQAAAGGVQAVTGAFTGAVGGSTRLYLIVLDASGNFSVVPGKIVNTAELTAGRVSLDYPDAPNLTCAVGAMRVALTAGTAFLPGTTALDATGVTTTFINLSTVPANPLTA